MKLSRPQRKMIFCTLMVIVTCVLWALGGKPWQWWALGAIFASWLADGLLAKYPPVLGKIPHSFFIGAVWFAIAHVCYSAASVMVLRSQGMPFHWRNFALLVLLFFATVFLHKLIFSRKSQRSKGFAIAATAYLAVVGIMASLSFLAAAGTAWRAWCLPIGACLFFISDCVLVVREYMRLKSKPINRLIMGTYLSGQLLLQIGLWMC
ncbi:MAG: lysoplasmalogenase [Clostridia bacterium]|nr:lysoplasmalogenase [Clostridia bacterium]